MKIKQQIKKPTNCVRLETFTVIKIHVVVFWVMTPSSDVVGYQCSGGQHCFHLQGEDNIKPQKLTMMLYTCRNSCI